MPIVSIQRGRPRAESSSFRKSSALIVTSARSLTVLLRSATSRLRRPCSIALKRGSKAAIRRKKCRAQCALSANPPIQAWMLDVAAAREAIADVGKIAVTGFCLGGTLTYGAATNLPGFSAAVGYYGGQIVRMADQSQKVPTMLHFGELDAHIPMSDVETIKSKQPSVDVYTYNADHGFQCDERDSFAPEAAQIAWGRTLRFIDSHM